MKFRIEPAKDKIHKYIGVFEEDEKITRIPFGAYNYEDYTTHKDKLRRERYIKRHRAREDWNNPKTAGTLSKMILWGNSTNLNTNVKLFKDKFNLE